MYEFSRIFKLRYIHTTTFKIFFLYTYQIQSVLTDFQKSSFQILSQSVVLHFLLSQSVTAYCLTAFPTPSTPIEDCSNNTSYYFTVNRMDWVEVQKTVGMVI